MDTDPKKRHVPPSTSIELTLSLYSAGKFPDKKNKSAAFGQSPKQYPMHPHPASSGYIEQTPELSFLTKQPPLKLLSLQILTVVAAWAMVTNPAMSGRRKEGCIL